LVKISTKQNILKQATSLIKEKGFDAVTINELCRVCNISKNTFYYYFESKEDLITSFFKINREITVENLNKFVTLESNFEMFWNILETLIDCYLEMDVEILKKVFTLNLTRNLETFQFMKDEKFSKMAELEISIIKKGQENGEIKNLSNPKDLLMTSYTICNGAAYFWCMTNGQTDMKKKCRRSIEALFFVGESKTSKISTDEIENR